MVSVVATPTAARQISALRGRARTEFDSWVERVKKQGCKALTYRLTGETVERLCDYHIRGQLRVLVAFETPQRARVVLVGPHSSKNPEMDVYAQLYETMGMPAPSGNRSKPPCCGQDGSPPVWGAEIDQLVDLFTRMARRRR